MTKMAGTGKPRRWKFGLGPGGWLEKGTGALKEAPTPALEIDALFFSTGPLEMGSFGRDVDKGIPISVNPIDEGERWDCWKMNGWSIFQLSHSSYVNSDRTVQGRIALVGPLDNPEVEIVEINRGGPVRFPFFITPHPNIKDEMDRSLGVIDRVFAAFGVVQPIW